MHTDSRQAPAAASTRPAGGFTPLDLADVRVVACRCGTIVLDTLEARRAHRGQHEALDRLLTGAES
jgi:hypothetical protein